MHAPAHICKELYRLHPQLRLAWAGRPRANKDELNAGSFALVQLYHPQDAGTPDEPNSFREFYEVGVVADPWGNAAMKHIDRGPVFSKTGRPRRDWDPLLRTPMLLAVFSDFGMDHYDILSKRFLFAVREWMKSPYERAVEAARERGRAFKSKVQDLGHEMGADLWRSALKHDSSINMAKKHQREDAGVKKLRAWKDKGGTNYEERFMPPPLPKA